MNDNIRFLICCLLCVGAGYFINDLVDHKPYYERDLEYLKLGPGWAGVPLLRGPRWDRTGLDEHLSEENDSLRFELLMMKINYWPVEKLRADSTWRQDWKLLLGADHPHWDPHIQVDATRRIQPEKKLIPTMYDYYTPVKIDTLTGQFYIAEDEVEFSVHP